MSQSKEYFAAAGGENLFTQPKINQVLPLNKTYMSLQLDHLRYPVGKFVMPEQFTPEQIDHWIADIDHFPMNLKRALEGLSEQHLDVPYRDGGWSIRQIVHHLADSHMNAFLRIRMALTEDNPTVKTYNQDAWGDLVDSRTAPVEWSLLIIEGVHRRWASVLRRVEDWNAAFFHPDLKRSFRIDQALALYQWHSRHHLAQISEIRQHAGW